MFLSLTLSAALCFEPCLQYPVQIVPADVDSVILSCLTERTKNKRLQKKPQQLLVSLSPKVIDNRMESRHLEAKSHTTYSFSFFPVSLCFLILLSKHFMTASTNFFADDCTSVLFRLNDPRYSG